MEKPCKCGEMMELELRTIVANQKMELRHVPVFHCDQCERNELLPLIKQLLIETIQNTSSDPQKKCIPFEQISEYTDVLYQMAKAKRDTRELGQLLEDRINQLLDLMNIAQDTNDQDWLQEIQRRLEQLSVSKKEQPTYL